MSQTVTGPLATSTLTASEKWGIVNKFCARYLVTGVTGASVSARIAAVLADVNLPGYWDTLAAYPGMRCVDRTVTLIDDNVGSFYVDVEYVPIADSQAGFIFESTGSLNQVTKERNYYGVPITVSHTYPADDPDFPSETVTQGASVSVMSPQITMAATGIIQVDYPLNTLVDWLWKVNSVAWMGGIAGGWLCVDVGHKLLDSSTSPYKYQFRFAFQYKPDGWNPMAYFIDSRTGEPPSGLVAGTGYKTVSSYPTKDFNELFPSTI
jgi:hypothetical protein